MTITITRDNKCKIVTRKVSKSESGLLKSGMNLKIRGDISLFKVKLFMTWWSPHTVLVRTVFFFPTYVFSVVISFHFSLLLPRFPLKLSLSLHNFLPLSNHQPSLSNQPSRPASYHHHSTQLLHKLTTIKCRKPQLPPQKPNNHQGVRDHKLPTTTPISTHKPNATINNT